MDLTVLGCSGSFAGADGPCSSYLVESDGFRLLMDIGNGSLSTLHRHGGPTGIDALVISHLHPDHWADLSGLMVSRRYCPQGDCPVLPVHAPAQTPSRFESYYGQPGVSDGVFDFQPLSVGSRRIGPFTLSTARMNHPVETYGLRLEADGVALTYSADTGECPALVDLARDTDVLLCEASFLDGPDMVPDLHLCGRQAAEHARAAGAKRLLLTHLVKSWGDPAATLAEAEAVFGGDVGLARTGQRYTIGR